MLEAGTTGNGVFAVKIHWHDLSDLLDRGREELDPSLGERELLETCFPRPRCLFIRRQDRVRQAISFLRALDSMQWLRLRGEAVNERMARSRIDLDQIPPLVDLFTEQEAEWRRFFERNDIDAWEVTYEQLLDDYERTITRALAHVGVPAPAGLKLGEPRSMRQADAITEAAVAAYEARRPQSGAVSAHTAR
jgi:LPS sulfotransferase NodH